MQSKNKLFGLLLFGITICAMPYIGYAQDDLISEDSTTETLIDFDEPSGSDATIMQDTSDEETIDTNKDTTELSNSLDEDSSAVAVANYDVNDTVFQQITDLEQEKVLMELEKERAQLDLDLDRLAAEKIKLQMEMDTLSGRAEQEQQILQNEKARLEAEAAKIEQEKRALESISETENETGDYAQTKTDNVKKKKTTPKKQVSSDDEIEDISTMYKLVNVMGAGNQLQATLSDLETGQTKRVSVGKTIDGFTVQSISLEDGVVFSKDGETQNLNISSR